MKRRDIIISAGLAAVILLPGAAQPQVLQKLWDTFKPPPFRIGELPAAEPATAPGETGAPAAPSAPPVAPSEPGSGWIALDPENLWVIETTKGVIIAELSPQIAPAYVARVKQLTRAGFYDGRKFFRVIDEFMAQTGDPQENGEGGSAMPTRGVDETARRDECICSTWPEMRRSASASFLSRMMNSKSKRESSESGRPMLAIGERLGSYLPYTGFAAATTEQRALSEA